MNKIQRRKTPSVQIGSVRIGSSHPVAIQSMTDTPTGNIDATLQQTIELIEAGSEMVRWTINDAASAKAVPEILRRLKDQGYTTPIIGDFHFNGHQLLHEYPQTAAGLAKYRINPGNVGKGKRHDENFANFIRTAKEHHKPVRIGVNWGSLDEELFTSMMTANAKRKKPKTFKEVTRSAMIESALRSADYAIKLGLKKDRIVLSVKMSSLPDMVAVYTELAKKCDYVLHLGLTEAGTGIEGVISSAAALSILLAQGIGDTIRISLTPQPGVKRAQEVEVCQILLQSLGFRHFTPTITSCPGCGRTNREYFQKLNETIHAYIKSRTPHWRRTYPGIEQLKIAVMGCVVNGPGESRHADVGISLPGMTERMQAPVYINGKKTVVLTGDDIANQFITILEDYIQHKY